MSGFGMPEVSYVCTGKLKNTRGFLSKLRHNMFLKRLDKYGKLGVQALKEHTPVDTGKTADSWGYEIEESESMVKLTWTNTNMSEYNAHIPIALLIQYGHEDRSGAWVEGIDYINPALKPIFDKLAKDSWEEVKKG